MVRYLCAWLFAVVVCVFQFCSEKRPQPESRIGQTQLLLFSAESFVDVNMERPPEDSAAEIRDFKSYLANGAKVDSVDSDSNTALILLSKTSREKYFSTVTALAKILLENKADLRITDYYKRNALHYACISGNKSLVELLVNNGADVNVYDQSNCSPVVYAVTNGDRVEIVDFLVQHGANLVWMDPVDSLTLLDVAEMRKYTKTAAFLKSKMAK